MAWCRQATSHYLRQCWRRSISPYDITRPQWVNKSPPSVAYMRQWIGSALDKIMACRLSAPSHYLNQCWVIVDWTLRNKLLWNFNQNTNTVIHTNASEIIVCEMAAILSRGIWVNNWPWPSSCSSIPPGLPPDPSTSQPTCGSPWAVSTRKHGTVQCHYNSIFSQIPVWKTKFLEHSPENKCPLYVLYKIPLAQANFLLA